MSWRGIVLGLVLGYALQRAWRELIVKPAAGVDPETTGDDD